MFTNVPAPLPDECLRGYGFRINASNARDLSTTSQLLPDLSEASGLSIPHLVTNHTHLAYSRFAHSAYGYLDFKNHPDLVSNRNICSGKTPVINARYCPDCNNEDLDLHGLTYWHRIHHLPGIDHCIKHDASLIITNSDDGYTQQPSTSSIVKTAIPKNRLESYFQSDHIKKFTHLCVATLEMGLSFEYFVIRNALINRYNKLKHGPFFNLAKIAYQKFPPFWLNKIFFGIDSNRIPSNPEKIFEALKNHSSIKSTKAYLILMALFWRDPREAIRECLFAYYSKPLEDGRIYFMRNKYSQF
jgi:hypothetical protein